MIKKIKDNLSSRHHKRFIIFILIALTVITIGIMVRIKANNALNQETHKQAIPLVAAITANSGQAKEELILPGNVVAWHEAIIYARTNGYIKKWLVDIGSKVKKDDLLAIIEIPEVEAQLRQAEADLNTAIANYKIAQTTAERWKNLFKTKSVSAQETDERISTAVASEATMNAARARRDMLKDLVSFKRVTAPFDGIISNRTTDIGTLINEGSNSTTLPLFNIVQANRLRIYVNVPQNYSSRIKPDIIANLSFAEHPGKIYPAKLLQTANAIDPTTRTLLTEFEVDNSNYELLPGGYTQVHLTIPALKGNIMLPVNTLIFRAQGLQVATIDKNNKVLLKSIKIARDFGTEVEIDSGIDVGETIIINPSDSLVTGSVVEAILSPVTKGSTSHS